MTAQSTEVFYSGVEVVVKTAKGIIDVSDDVVSCSVSRRISAIANCNITLNNTASWGKGKYNNGNYTITVGDPIHVYFLKNSTKIEEFTGKVFKLPAFNFYGETFAFEAQDCISDLHYIFWDPSAQKAIEKFYNESKNITDETNDGASGVQLNSFLQEVCGFPEDAIKIAKFPEQEDFIESIMTVIAGKDYTTEHDEAALKLFKNLFGLATDYDNDDSTSGANSNDVESYSACIKSLIGAKTKATSADLDSKVRFVQTKGPRQTDIPWSLQDGTSHTGAYGLTKAQMKKFGGKDKDAKDCSLAAQTVVMKKLVMEISKDIKSTDPTNITFFYFTAMNIKSTSGLTMPDGAQLHIGSTVYTKKNEFEKAVKKVFTGSGTGDITDDSSSTSTPTTKSSTSSSSTSSSSSSDSTTDKNKAAAKAKLDAFLKKHGEGTAATDVDNAYGHQCWDLYLAYGQEVLGFKMGSGDMYQDGNNNGSFWDAMPKTADSKAKLQKLTSSDTPRQGDIVFWRHSAGSYASGHVAIVMSDKGNAVDCIGQGGSVSTVQRQTIPKNSNGYSLAGYLRPKMFDGVVTSDASSSDDSSTSSSSSDTASEAADYAYKLFKYVSYTGETYNYESEMLTGPLALHNDEKAINFVQSMCKASMREFMSLPDGSFAAFVPDYFGKMGDNGVLKNVITIPKINIIDYSITFDKASYVSHVYLLTREHLNTQYGDVVNSYNEVMRLQESSGVVSLEKQGDVLLNVIDTSITGIPNSAADIMKRFGVNVYKETDNYIIDSTMTATKALMIFMEQWAKCFSNTLKLTFRPEILPGIRLSIEGADVTVFVQSVTHSWSADSGGTTSVTVSSPVKNSSGKIGS